MGLIRRLNKKLNKMFNGSVHAQEENGCVKLTGSLDCWEDIVKAGYTAVNKNKFIGVLNDIEYTKRDIPQMRMPSVNDLKYDKIHTDVAVIGAGIIGSAIARELTRYDIKVMLIDKEHDVGMHASSRNDGEIHPGIDLLKGQVKQKYNSRGNVMYDQICKDLDVRFSRPGQYLCFNKKYYKLIFSIARLYWKAMGIPTEYMNADKLRKKIPGISNAINGGIYFPTAGIVSPYELVIAYAENAVDNNAVIALDTAVTGMEISSNKIVSLKTNRGTIYPKVVINAAGVYSDKIASMANDRFFTIHARKGTNAIFDKKIVKNNNFIVSVYGMSSVKTTHSKGGGILTTADGNLLIGPDAFETFDREDFSTEDKNINAILEKHRTTIPGIKKSDVIAYYSGIRAATYEEDFVISKGRRTKNIIHAAGIQSPGLTAAPAIALDIAEMTKDILSEDMEIKENKDFNPIRKAILDIKNMNEDEKNILIEQNPDFGIVICRCEEITLGQIKQAINRSVPCDTVDGVKRRVRAGMGRCQGGFCGPLVLQTIAKEKNIALKEVTKKDNESLILYESWKGV